MSRLRLALGGILLLLVAVACEYPGIERATKGGLPAGVAASVTTDGHSAQAVSATGQAAQGRQVGSSDKPLPAGEIAITEKDFFLDPETIYAQPGKITFVISNAGRYTHDFRVKGEGLEERSQKIGIGRTQRFSLELREGEYEIACPLSNHADRGMMGKLIIKR